MKIIIHFPFLKKKRLPIEKLIDSKLSNLEKAKLLYQQGLLKSIFLTPRYHLSYFYIVACAAVGNVELAKNLLIKYRNTKDFSKNKKALAKAISPFDPKLALDIIENIKDNGNNFLIGHLLSTLNKKKELEYLLNTLSPKEYVKNADFFLLRNKIDGCNTAKLYNINQYLDSYKLPNIDLFSYSENVYLSNFKIAKPITQLHLNKNAPLISILVTTYNSENYIEFCLQSLINQTYPNKEIIVVDDNSTDNTVGKVKNIIENNSEVHLIQLSENCGTFVAKNIGECFAKGEFLTYQDSDDWAYPLKLEYQIIPLLKDKSLVATFSKWVRIDSTGVFYSRYPDKITRFNPTSVLFRRNIVKNKMGLWDNVRIGADSEFNQRLRLNFKNQIKNINLPLTFASHRPNSLMNTKGTGYIYGVSKQRLDYWEKWNNWHLKCLKEGKLPTLPLII